MRTGLVPLKAGGRAKRRLAETMTAADHKTIIQALLEDCLDLCVSVPQVRWWVISDDPSVEREAEARGLGLIHDEGGGLNAALQIGIETVTAQGGGYVTIVPGDVPLAQPEDIEDIFDTAETSEVVVVPSSDGGTNALSLQLPTRVTPAFGSNSLATHVDQASELGLRCSILDLPRLALDLDTEEDARRILAEGRDGGRTVEVLRRLYG